MASNKKNLLTISSYSDNNLRDCVTNNYIITNHCWNSNIEPVNFYLTFMPMSQWKGF